MNTLLGALSLVFVFLVEAEFGIHIIYHALTGKAGLNDPPFDYLKEVYNILWEYFSVKKPVRSFIRKATLKTKSILRKQKSVWTNFCEKAKDVSKRNNIKEENINSFQEKQKSCK